MGLICSACLCCIFHHKMIDPIGVSIKGRASVFARLTILNFFFTVFLLLIYGVIGWNFVVLIAQVDLFVFCLFEVSPYGL